MKKQFSRVQFLCNKIYEFSEIRKECPVLYYSDTCLKGDALPAFSAKEWKEFKKGDVWGTVPDFHCWFYTNVDIGEYEKFPNYRLHFSTGTTDDDWNVHNPQFLVYVNGQLRQALDANHREILLQAGQPAEIYLYAYNGIHADTPVHNQIALCEYDSISDSLYYCVDTLLEILKYTDVKTKFYTFCLSFLEDVLGKIDFSIAGSDAYFEQVAEAYQRIENELIPQIRDEFNPTLYAVGSSHLDVAWHWTVSQTREKICRTVANALNYMKRFPEYKFFSAQALLYEFLQEEEPALFEEVKERVKEGLWNAEGAVYVEPDCNMISGESMIRQILYGKTFYKEHFGVDSKIGYLPDTFGFSGAMPQILKKCGITNFITSKLSWNDTTAYPHDLFKWRGIDGSEVVSYFITAKHNDKWFPLTEIYANELLKKYNGTNYGAFAEPSYAIGTYENFKEKNITDDLLFVYGYSDGGGGPTYKHIKELETMSESIRNCPRTRFATLTEFVDRLNANIEGKTLPVWAGELYLQFHRGVLTSMASCKRNNRFAENQIMYTEFLSVLSEQILGISYPKKELDEIWKKILINQFHDILPGSAIEEQYDITLVEYREIFERLDALIRYREEKLGEYMVGGNHLIVNPTSFEVDDYVEIDGNYHYVSNIPPKGAISLTIESEKTCEERNYISQKLENKYYSIAFNDNYEIVSLYDKANDREVITEAQSANVLKAYADFPHEFDAWELKDYVKEKFYKVDNLTDVQFENKGGKFGYVITRTFRNSTIRQGIYLFEQKEGIYFETNVDWHEQHILLKTEFPVDVKAETALYDIQFGSVRRSTHYNTPWDEAMYEVCGHKYADLSDNVYGVSLINDCKYGYDIHEGVIQMSLIKSPTFPNPHADQGVHEFTYVLYPHKGSAEQAKTQYYAYLLNQPLRVVKQTSDKDQVAENRQLMSLIKSDKNNVIVETIKKSENQEAIVVRIYESNGKDTEVNLELYTGAKRVVLCDMLENEECAVEVTENHVQLQFTPFEIKTVKICLM